jgi:hypothetical protein
VSKKSPAPTKKRKRKKKDTTPVTAGTKFMASLRGRMRKRAEARASQTGVTAAILVPTFSPPAPLVGPAARSHPQKKRKKVKVKRVKDELQVSGGPVRTTGRGVPKRAPPEYVDTVFKCAKCKEDSSVLSLAKRTACFFTRECGEDRLCIRFPLILAEQTRRAKNESPCTLYCGTCNGYPAETNFNKSVEVNRAPWHLTTIKNAMGSRAVPGFPAALE